MNKGNEARTKLGTRADFDNKKQTYHRLKEVKKQT